MIQNLLKKAATCPSVALLNHQAREIACYSPIEEALVIAASFNQNPRNLVIIKENNYQAQILFQKLTPLIKAQCVLFDVEESLRVQAITSSIEASAARIEALAHLLDNSFKICVTHIGALAHHFMKPDSFKENMISLKINEEISISELKRKCQNAGYTYVSRVDQPLCFAARGGILDIFSINYPNPIRIEFFDNEIESIRFFDISTQRTISTVDEVTLLCAGELLFNDDELNTIKRKVEKEFNEFKIKNPELADTLQDTLSMDIEFLENCISESRLYPYFSYLEQTGNLLDYIDHPHLIYSNPGKCSDHLKQMMEESITYIQEMVQEGKMLPHFSLYHDVTHILSQFSLTEMNPFLNRSSTIRQTSLPAEPLHILTEILDEQAQNKSIVLCLNETEITEIIKLCVQKNISYQIAFDEISANGLYLFEGNLDEGFELTDHNLIVYTSRECFRKKRKAGKFINKFNQAEALSSYQDLNPKDYIVHQQHGVGQYVGIITREIGGIHRDYLQILFKGNDELLVPLEQFSLVRKFVSREGVSPKLNKLGSNEWSKTKAKLKANVEDIAERLINLYSMREENIGFAFSEDNDEQRQFDEEFEYELTPDQTLAVQQIKEDMMKPKPMDRLLCGDVGFGKTEVAIRAAFKAVLDGKQVAFLCPTTILSLQHFKTFQSRVDSHAVKVAVLNRFVTETNQKRILEEVKEGKIDILIGTHRILSKDVKFKDLGFLIIDEEQRFGVEHKEKIKEMKQSIDVLSLSATPIPRTLQMSLIGIRSLSQLDTPPNNRYPVQTYVVEKNQNLIIDVIEKELARDGQVFYLFNNIDQIYNVARTLQVQLPEAKIAVAHGKMNREEIEEVMLQFSNGEFNVLICTTIIETGIDIPNANTILVDQADRFGLSQLYQIKGRVGRSDRVAYAYLLVNRFKQLSEIASKRLQSIKEFSELGSGYKIAMRDLTIRGAGDLLGANQSGFIDAVGIDYYIEMLQEAINEKKGIKTEKKVQKIKPQVQVDSYIPESFAPQDLEKISMYQKIDKIETAEELNLYYDEIRDNYGHFPKSVQLLFEKKRLELLINDPDVESFKEIRLGSEIIFSVDFSNRVDGIKMFERFTTLSKDIKIKYQNNKIKVSLPKRQDSLPLAIEVLSLAKECTR